MVIGDLNPEERYMPYVVMTTADGLPFYRMFDEENPIFIAPTPLEDAPERSLFIESGREDGRVGYSRFAKSLEGNKEFSDLIETLVRNQGDVDIKMFRNAGYFKFLFDKPGVNPFGLSPEESDKLNNKVWQYEKLRGKVPIADFRVCDRKSALEEFGSLNSPEGVLSILPYGGGASGVRNHCTIDSLSSYLSSENLTSDFLLVRTLAVEETPSIDVLVANPDEVLVYGLTEQVFGDNRFRCLGAKYPFCGDDTTKRRYYELAEEVGKIIGEEGFKGYFNIDFIKDSSGNIFFSEINGRYSGASAYRALAMNQVRSAGHPKISDLEKMAVRKGTFGGFELWEEPTGMYWFKSTLYSDKDGFVQRFDTRNNLARIYSSGGTGISGQIRRGIRAERNRTQLGNFISVQKDEESLGDSLREMDYIRDNLVR